MTMREIYLSALYIKYTVSYRASAFYTYLFADDANNCCPVAAAITTGYE